MTDAPRPLPSALLERLEQALQAGELPALASALCGEGHPIAEVYHLVYGAFQTHLRSASRTDDVATVLAACELVQNALGARFEASMADRLNNALRENNLRELVGTLHDQEKWTKPSIYETLWTFTFVLRMENREDDEARVGDELDSLSGWSASAAAVVAESRQK